MKLSVCNYQMSTDSFSSTSIERYRFIDVKIMSFYINMNKLKDIIKSILSDFCNATVIGYNKKLNKYWFKIYKNKYCTLYVEIEILNKDDEISFVKFVPIIGTDTLIENFVLNFTESIHLYTTSSFIKSYLEGNFDL